jgi:hypothetical protein
MSLPTNFFIGRGSSAQLLQLDTTNAFYNSYNTEVVRHEGDGTGDGAARIVLNGYGILLYGWVRSGTGTGASSIQLPPALVGNQIDIEAVGVGGGGAGGGSGGSAGGAGIRVFYTPTSDSFYIRTGCNLRTDSPNYAGYVDKANLGLYNNVGTEIIALSHEDKDGGSAVRDYGNGAALIYKSFGQAKNHTAGFTQENQYPANASASNYLSTTDQNWASHVSYGGGGNGLNGFSTDMGSRKNGSGLGGGGGGQDATNYGGNGSGGTGGRYGYSGGNDRQNGSGPNGGKGRQHSGGHTYMGGAGGAFGGGVGDAGNSGAENSTGAGAILIRWDTTPYGADVGFQSGRQGWP